MSIRLMLLISVISLSNIAHAHEIKKLQTIICSNAHDLKKFAKTVTEYKDIIAVIDDCKEDATTCPNVLHIINEIEAHQNKIRILTKNFEDGTCGLLDYMYYLGKNNFSDIKKLENMYCHSSWRNPEDSIQMNLEAIEIVEKNQKQLQKTINIIKDAVKMLNDVQQYVKKQQ